MAEITKINIKGVDYDIGGTGGESANDTYTLNIDLDTYMGASYSEGFKQLIKSLGTINLFLRGTVDTLITQTIDIEYSDLGLTGEGDITYKYITINATSAEENGDTIYTITFQLASISAPAPKGKNYIFIATGFPVINNDKFIQAFVSLDLYNGGAFSPSIKIDNIVIPTTTTE